MKRVSLSRNLNFVTEPSRVWYNVESYTNRVCAVALTVETKNNETCSMLLCVSTVSKTCNVACMVCMAT